MFDLFTLCWFGYLEKMLRIFPHKVTYLSLSFLWRNAFSSFHVICNGNSLSIPKGKNLFILSLRITVTLSQCLNTVCNWTGVCIDRTVSGRNRSHLIIFKSIPSLYEHAFHIPVKTYMKESSGISEQSIIIQYAEILHQSMDNWNFVAGVWTHFHSMNVVYWIDTAEWVLVTFWQDL